MAYDDTLYGNPGPSLLGTLGDFALFAGVEYGHRKTTSVLAGARQTSHTPLGWARDRHRQRAAMRASREIWQGFRKPEGFAFRERWRGARRAAGELGIRRYQKAGTFGKSLLGETAEINMAYGKATGRAIAGLARPFLGIAHAYLTWGTLVKGGIEAAAAGVGELKRFGERLRSKVPETSVGWRDMAVREQAFTMRQASLMAAHMSQSGVRAALGNEASFLHS